MGKITLLNDFKAGGISKITIINKCSQKSALEAEAYSEYLTGLYNFEIEHWENSLTNSAKALEIYNELMKISDLLD